MADDPRLDQRLNKLEWRYACTHCGVTYQKRHLTFSGGLHCTSCDEVSEMPERVVYESTVRALLVEHAAEVDRLSAALSGDDERLRRAADRVGVVWVGCDTLSAALQQATQGSAKPSYKGHIDPDCEVARGVGGYCTCETPEEKAEEARERAEIEAALEAESQQATQEQDWQPIETAPKDGTTILIAHAGRIDSSRWVPYAMAHLCEPHIGRWLGEWFREPTHWRPLPLPPAPGGHQP